VFLQGLGTLMQTLYPGASRGPAAFQAALYVCLGCLLAVSLLYILTSDQKVNQ
jgi:hypothetical protein